MSNIIVTGGAGYIGSVCSARLLEQGHQVTVVDDLSTGHAAAVPRGAVLYECDIADCQSLRDLVSSESFDVVFHFAAKALIPESVSNPGVFFDSNVAASIAFLETIRTAGIRRFVFSSSAAVYGSPSVPSIGEDHPKNPVNAYGETKLMLERVLQWYAAAYGWTIIAFRYFNACGGTDTAGEDHKPETHIIPLLLQTASGERDLFQVFGSDYPTPDGTCLRDYVHVEDIADAHLLALNVKQPSRMSVYNIGAGTSYSVLQICQAVEQELSRKVNIEYGPRRAGDPAILCANPQLLIKELGWKPRRSDLQTIVRSAWQWKEQHPYGYSTRQMAGSATSR
jgi:UDP-glucose 4-epimerase